VKRLPDLLPPLDQALGDALERYDSAATTEARMSVGLEAVGRIRAYQRMLAGSSGLGRIDDFARADLGGFQVSQPLRSQLSESMVEINRTMSGR
jgi:hypothetical protein